MGRKAHPKVWEGLEGQLGGFEDHSHDREGLGGPPGGPAGVGRPSQRSWKGQEAQPKVREGSGDPSKGLGGAKKPTRIPGRSREAHSEFQAG